MSKLMKGQQRNTVITLDANPEIEPSTAHSVLYIRM